MSGAADLLNMDVADVGAALRRGFDWWVAELRAMLPARWIRAGRAAAVARLLPDGALRVERGGAMVPLDPARPVDAAVALDPRDVLVRELSWLRLSPADTRKAVALDLDRLVPFAPSDLWFAVELGAGDPARRTRPLTLAAVRRETAAAALDRAMGAGVRPAALGVAASGGGVRFDFLPAVAAAVAPPPWWARRDLWWAAAGLLAAANVLFAVAQDRADVDRLAALTAAQADQVALAARLKARVAGEDRRRAALADTRERAEPLAVVAALSRAVPPPAWAQRLLWDGRRVELSGFAPVGVDPVAAVRRAAAFRDVRAGGTEISASGLTTPPFELSARWAAAR